MTQPSRTTVEDSDKAVWHHGRSRRIAIFFFMFPTYLLASFVLVALTFMLRFRTEWKTWAAAFYRVGIFSAVSVLILPPLWLVLKCVRVRFPSMLQNLGPFRFSLRRVWNYVTVVLFIASWLMLITHAFLIAWPLGELMAARSIPASTAATWFPGQPRKRIAVVGGGPSGVFATLMLHNLPEQYEFVLYEAEKQLGGHGYGSPFQYVDKAGKWQQTNVEMGFIFGEHCGYDLMRKLMAFYNVSATVSKISVSMSDEGGKVKYATDDPALADEAEFDRFNRLLHPVVLRVEAKKLLWSDTMTTFEEWLNEHEFSENFRATYLSPLFMTLFIIKTGMYQYPVAFIAQMFNKYIDLFHGTTAFGIEGSSRALYDRITQDLGRNPHGRVELASPIKAVTRLRPPTQHESRVRVTTWNGVSEDFDGVVLAVGANVARSLLGHGGTSSHWEQYLLQQVQYGEMIEMILHTDKSFLPAERRHWRSFNFKPHSARYTRDSDFAFHALMSRSPPINDFDEDVSPLPILSTNPERPIPEDKILDRQKWDHMQGDIFLLILTQAFGFIDSIQGNQGVAFAGEWSRGLIGHEMAMRSGKDALAWLGMTAGNQTTDDITHAHTVTNDTVIGSESTPVDGQSSPQCHGVQFSDPILAQCPSPEHLEDADVCLLADRQPALHRQCKTTPVCTSGFLRPSSPKVHDAELDGRETYFVIARACFWIVVISMGISMLGLAYGAATIIHMYVAAQGSKRRVQDDNQQLDEIAIQEEDAEMKKQEEALWASACPSTPTTVSPTPPGTDNTEP